MNSTTKKHFLDQNMTTTNMPDFEDEVEDFGFFEEKRKETEQFLQALKNLELLSVDSYTSKKQKKNKTISVDDAKSLLQSSEPVKKSPRMSTEALLKAVTNDLSAVTPKNSTSPTKDTTKNSTSPKNESTSPPKLRIAHIPSPTKKTSSSSPPPGSVSARTKTTRTKYRKRSNSKDSEDVTEELWKIFVFYSTHGDPTTPQSLAYTEWLRFLRGYIQSCETVHIAYLQIEKSFRPPYEHSYF